MSPVAEKDEDEEAGDRTVFPDLEYVAELGWLLSTAGCAEYWGNVRLTIARIMGGYLPGYSHSSDQIPV